MSASKFEAPAYLPRIKARGFDPTPVQGIIPRYADSHSDPKVIGTAAWKSYWEEQLYYCENGYDTGGLHLPGPYYHFLNFKIIDGVGGPTYPDFVDLHYEIFDTIKWLKEENRPGIVIPKGRRKGLSFTGMQVLSHGMQFQNRYRALVAGGESSYVDGFRSKLYRTYNNTVNEFKLNHVRRNDNELILGWIENTEQGPQEFSHASIFFKTMKDNPKKGEGEYFNDVILEEFGIFEKGIETLNSILPALKHGDKYLGFVMAFGTGGNIQRGSKAFKELYYNAESFGFYKMFISGARYYPPYVNGVIDPVTGEKGYETPNILKEYPDLQPEQLLGCEDVKKATEVILTERAKRAKNPNKSQLREWNQHYPLTDEEVFISSGSNKFNTDKLYTQAHRIESEAPKYREYFLSFKKDTDGQVLMPYQVEARLAEPGDKPWDIVKVLELPRTEYKNLDIVGIDGYNEDKTDTSKSLGAIVVTRRYDKVYGDEGRAVTKAKKPIMLYYERPPRKEVFWEMCLKISVWVDAIKNTMISAESDMVIKYYKDMGAKKYLSPRPKEFDSPDSKQKHDYGAKMTVYSKPRMLSIMQTSVEDDSGEWWFIELVHDHIAYDDENIGTDYDAADAYGLSLMRIIDMKRDPLKDDEKSIDSTALPTFRVAEDGTLLEANNQGDNYTDGGELEDWEKNLIGEPDDDY